MCVGECGCVWVCERESAHVFYVCVCERERDREREFCVRENVCVRVCECVMRVWECVCLFVFRDA